MVSKVKILGKVYEVKKEDAMSDIMENGDIRGKVHLYNDTIYLSKELKQQQIQLTLLHEICHIVDLALDLNLDEPGVKRISEALYAIIVDNPKLFKMIGE